MKAILPLAIILGFYAMLVSAQDEHLSKYCEECLRKSATSGMYPHPNRCDAFVQCDVLEKTFRAYVKMCPPGLFYDERIGTCNWESQVPCNKDCKTSTAIKDAFTCNGFFECKNGQRNSNKMFCPNQQRFDETQSKCIPDPKCPPPKKPLQCFPNFKLHPSDPSKFFQAAGKGWIEQRCAVGTGFNMTTCTCSNALNVNNKQVCKLVNLPMTQNLVEQAHNWYINFKDVYIVNNAAEFKPNSYLIVPVVTNNDFHDQISITISFKLGNVQQNTVAVLGNSECKIVPTFGIHVRNPNTNSPQVVGQFIMEGTTTPVDISATMIPNAWTTVKLVKKGDTVSMWVNNNLVGQKTLRGFIKKQDCALTLGQSFGMGNFTGFMKNVEINKCP